jgi:hypothetical protein
VGDWGLGLFKLARPESALELVMLGIKLEYGRDEIWDQDGEW